MQRGNIPQPWRPSVASGALGEHVQQSAFLEKTQGAAGPEAHLRARFLPNDDGTVGRPWAPELAIRQALTNEMKAMSSAYNPEPIRVPALAMYAVPKSAGDLIRPWYPANDPAVRERVETFFRLARERFARQAKWFGAFALRGRVSEISGAHHLFLSHPREVFQQIDAFVSSLPATP